MSSESESEIVPLTCTLKQAAQLLNTSERTVLRLIDRRFLTRVPDIGRILIPRQQVEAFVTRAPAPAPFKE